MLSLSLSLALSASSWAAQPRIAELKAVSLVQTPATYSFSPDMTLSAVSGDNGVTVWSVQKGKPLFRIERPEIAGASAKDSFDFSASNFSPDSRYLIAKLKQFKFDSSGTFQGVKLHFMLVSIEEEKIVSKLLEVEGPNYSVSGMATGDTEGWANFAPDAKKVYLWTRRTLPGYADDQKGDIKTIHAYTVVGLDGRKEAEYEQMRVRERGKDNFEDRPVNRAYQEFAGFDADGVLYGVAKDKDSCALKNLATNKRLAFLDDCTEKDNPGLSGSGFLAMRYSADTPPYFKVWRMDGALQSKVERFPEGKFHTTSFNLTRDGRYALDWRGGDEMEIRLWDMKARKLLASSKSKQFTDGFAAWVTPDRHIVYVADGKTHYARLDAGTPLEPEPKRFVARLEEPVAAAEQEAPAPAPAAREPRPAADFDVPPKTAMPTDSDAYAVVIGIEKYRQQGIPAVDFAARDARTMYDHLVHAMGFDSRNVVLLTDEQAVKTDLEKHLGSWLKNRVGPKSRVFVYYAGHGAPNPATGEGYLMPYEADPNYLDDTAFPLAKLHAAVAKLPTKDVTVVLDACFSGQGGRSLLAKGARPLVNAVAAPAAPNAVVLSAAASNQISASNPERRHGLLTSYILEALHGAADANGDRQITTAELYAFVRPAVERAARLQNLEQTPVLAPADAAAAPGRAWIKLSPAASKRAN